MIEETIDELIFDEIQDFNLLMSNICQSLQQEDYKDRKICLNLKQADLNEIQLRTLESLLDSNGSLLCEISTSSALTKQSAKALGLVVNFEESVSDSKTENVSISQDDAEKKLEEMFSVEEDEIVSGNEKDFEILNMPTKYVKQTLRSGQSIEFDGNLVLIGDVKSGSEIKASGDITVWGKLLGLCHAGCSGNRKARIRALNLNPVQIRIADYYSRRPDGSNIDLNERRNFINVEEAMILDDQIRIFRMID